MSKLTDSLKAVIDQADILAVKVQDGSATPEEKNTFKELSAGLKAKDNSSSKGTDKDIRSSQGTDKERATIKFWKANLNKYLKDNEEKEEVIQIKTIERIH